MMGGLWVVAGIIARGVPMSNLKGLSPRELDALVARDVLGWRLSDDGDRIVKPDGSPVVVSVSDRGDSVIDILIALDEEGIPYHGKFTNDIGAAWRVVEHMWEDDWQLEVAYSKPDETSLYFWIPEEYEKPMHTAMDTPSAASAKAPTMPEAICLAALRAKDVVQNE